MKRASSLLLVVWSLLALCAFARADDEVAAPAPVAVSSDTPVAPAAPVETGKPDVVPAAAPVGAAASIPAFTAKKFEFTGPVKIYVIPVRDAIGEPTLYIIRRGVKDAIAAGANVVVLDMDTRGGDGGAMIKITEIMERFEGRTVTYVNRQALSAGAIIAAATDDIYFVPRAEIGAAAPVDQSGADIQSTMKGKVVSSLSARVRSISEGHRYRGDVISAMMDEAFELKIDDVVIKSKDSKPLTLTSTEAMKLYGVPPQPLLGAGIAEDLPALYKTLAGGKEFEVRAFEMTWSIKFSQWLTSISPILMAIAGLCMLIEFKTQGFTGLGIVGVALFLIVFFGHYAAGLSDHTPMLVFLVGVVLVFVELFFFPGAVVVALTGALLMLGSLIYGMADIWPGQATSFDFDPDVFLRPITNLGVAMLIGTVLAIALLRYMPKSWLWDRMILSAAVTGVGGSPESSLGMGTARSSTESLIGATGTAVTGLFPSGEIDVNGVRVQARVDIGSAAAGAAVRVLRRADFVYVVEVIA